MQSRYFIGVTLPVELRHDISKAQHELFAPGKVMPPLKPHITLLHPDLLRTLSPLHFVPRIKEAAEACMPFNIKLTHIAMFDKRVLYIAIESPGLIVLQQKLVELLPEKIRAQYGVGRTFQPHLTLVQAKPKQDLEPALISAFTKRSAPLLPQSFEAHYLNKFTWIGPRFYRIESI